MEFFQRKHILLRKLVNLDPDKNWKDTRMKRLAQRDNSYVLVTILNTNGETEIENSFQQQFTHVCFEELG